MPSTPRCQEMPRSLDPGGLLDQLEAGVAGLERDEDGDGEGAGGDREERRHQPGRARARRRDTSAVTSAPMAGSTTMAVRSGKLGASASARRAVTARLLRTVRTRDQHDRADGDAQGVGADVAGLDAAGPVPTPRTSAATPLTAPSMTCGRTRPRPRRPAPGPPMKAADRRVVVPAVGEDLGLGRALLEAAPQVDVDRGARCRRARRRWR